MATMAPPNPAAPAAPPAPAPMEAPPEVAKALDQTVQGLAKLYMACHKMEPDSPLCNAVMELQKAVAEVGNNIGMPSASADAPMAEGDPAMAEAPMDPMMGGEMPAEDPMAGGMPAEEEPLPPGYSIEDAAGDTQSMMQEAAKRRLGQ